MSASRRAIVVIATLALVTHAATARAGDAEHAQALFDEGVRLMEDGRYEDACPRLEESDRLDPGGGTVLDLAHCFEQIGRAGRAFDAYVVARERAVRDGRAERQGLAEARLAALAPSVARVRLVIRRSPDDPHGAYAPDAAIVLVDGRRTPLDRDGAFHTERGAHDLVVRPPNGEPWTRRLDARSDVDVDPPDAHAPPAAPPAPAPLPARNGRRTAAFVVGGAGLASLGAGLALGAFAFSRQAESDRECPSGACTERGVAAENDAKHFALGADIGVAVGVVALGTALYLFLTSSPRAPTSALVAF